MAFMAAVALYSEEKAAMLSSWKAGLFEDTSVTFAKRAG